MICCFRIINLYFRNYFVKRIQDAVRNVKASREMEEQFMLLEELIREEREDARKQALAARSMDEFRKAVSSRDVDRHDGSVR